MKSFIITADDYGMCDIVDKAIDDCIEAGLLTSTNIIVNMDDFSATQGLREKYPNISLGLHWNVTAGKPISNVADIQSIVNPETGEFWKPAQFLLLFKKGYVRKEELRRELIAQYNLFKSRCGEPDYWNTHQNSALSFNTFPAFNNIALELGINKTRSFRRVYIKNKGLDFLSSLKEIVKKNILDIWFGMIIPRSGTKMPDGRMIYFNEGDKTADIENIGGNVKWGNKRIVELVIHPAISPDYPLFGTITTERVKEWKLFTAPATKKYFAKEGIELVTFNNII